ncbi:hypothetical protein V5O48_011958 [Marasmius crinis-equi]|uniref:N-terminal Ras-GEF domain-containing protein n=1 Tax=Marasmius crinis-equi TaxID=585013 RepID=A0ABR3F432_9AGAR
MSVESTSSEDHSIFLRTDTISSGTTEPGLGYLSGRAIKRLGEAVLNGVDDMLVNREINRIESYFRKNSVPAGQDAVRKAEGMYHTLLELTRGDISTIYAAGYQSYSFHLVPGASPSGPIIVYLALIALLGTRDHAYMITNLISQNLLGASEPSDSEEDEAFAQLLRLLSAKTNNGTCTGNASDFLTWCRLFEISKCPPPSQISWALGHLLQEMGHLDEKEGPHFTFTIPKISYLASLVSSADLLSKDDKPLAEVIDLMSDPRENAGFLANLERRVAPADLVLQDGYLIGGTPEALLEYLTSPSIAYARPYFRVFSLTFKTFTTVEEFFDKIANRLRGKPPPYIPREQEGQWKEIVQLR